MEKSFCCCWCKTGPLSLDIRLPVTGYCSGQTIPLDINCENNSGVSIVDITIQLIKACIIKFACIINTNKYFGNSKNANINSNFNFVVRHIQMYHAH